MTDLEISAFAKGAASDLLKAFGTLGYDGEDVVYAVECLTAYLLGSIVMPGHDREMLSDVHDGIASALVSFRQNEAQGGAPLTNAKSHLDQFLDGIGVRLVPVARRRRGAQSHARATMREILNDHGGDHLALVLRFIRDSEGNKSALWSETIGALSDILLQRPDWTERASDVFAALDSIDLNEMRRRAVLRRPWPVRHSLRASLYDALEQRLDTRIDKDLLGAAA